MNDSGLNFTGERMVPGKVDKVLLHEHVARYRFALDYAQGMKVLDAACGSGYGTHILSSVAKHVIGVDVSADAIEYAGKHYKLDNNNFTVANVLQLPFDDDSFDLVTAFEIFEHLESPTDFILEIKRVLNKTGSALISTPNGEYEKSTIENEYHHHEYSFSDFSSIIASGFKGKITYIGQINKSRGSALKKKLIRFKRTLGIGPILKKNIHNISDPSEFLTMDLPYEFTTENIEKAEFFIAVIHNDEA